MEKINIGNRTLIVSQTFFIPDGEEVEIQTSTSENELLKIRLTCQFVGDQSNTPAPIIRHDLVGEHIVFKFENFTESLGAATNRHTDFAASKVGSTYSYFAVTYRLKGATKIEFQVLLGSKS